MTLEAGRAARHYWQDLWRYRELLAFLAWRDVLVRYKQTALGIAWALLRPLLTMLVLTFVFGRLARLPSGGAPYPVLVLAGLLPWQLFASALTECASSLVANSSLLSKVYFPRLVAPFSTILVSVVDFAVSLAMVAALMAWYGYSPGWRAALLPVFVAQALLVVIGPGLWLAALNVKYRDFRYVVPFVVQFGLYVSPVGFSSEVIPAAWRLAYSLNPMVGVIDGFRWALLPEAALYWPGFVTSTLVSVVLLFAGLSYFRSVEREFADIV